MSTMRIYCFGDFRVEIDNNLVSDFDTDKTRALLAYLAVEAGRPLRRSHLAGLLWTEESEERALHNLRQTLVYLRKVLGSKASATHFILANRDSIQLNPSADIWVDAKAFTQSLDNAYRYFQCQKGQGLFNVRYLLQALDYYQGQFLHQFYLNKCVLFEEWAALMRGNLGLKAIKGLALLAEYHERRAEYNLALDAATRIVDLSPWDESARAQVIRLLGVNQQWSAAQSHYFALRNYLAEQLDLSPSAELTALNEQVQAAAAGKAAITPRFPPARHYLPDSFSPFVGRESELDAVMDSVVNPETRLITLIGPGGIGKTRFALEIAHQLVGVAADGVYFVSLVAAQMPGQIIQFIAEVLDLVFSEESDPRKQLLDHLRDKELLLVLDNFDHLLFDPQSTRLLDEILCSTSRVTFLVTSRERLNLQQECIYVLNGLNYPQNNHITLENAHQFDALAMFARRASFLQRDFVLNEASLPKVVRICRIVEGFPLGVELAVAAIWEQGYDTIAERIEHDLDVITTSITNIHPRHRNLRAAFQVSWSLLAAHQQSVLSQVSIFRDGFDRRAALHVANASTEMLALLVAKSLLRCDENDRYYFHEVIRHFVVEKLAEAGCQQPVRARHAHYYVTFLAGQDAALKGPAQRAALAEIQQEFGNVSQMWNWLVENCLAAEISACVDSLYQFFRVRSLFREGMQWFEQGVNSLQGEPASELALGMLLSRLGALAHLARENDQALDALLRSQEIFQQHSMLSELAYCRIHLGWVYQREKDFATALEFGGQSLAYYHSVSDALGELQAFSLLGSIRKRQGSNREARQLFDQALHLCRQAGNPRQLVTILNRLGDLACYEGQYETAVGQFLECLEISKGLNDRFNQAILLNNLGTIYHVWKDYLRALDYYQKSLDICREIGDQDGIALALNNLGELALVQGDRLSAIQYSENALQIAEKLQEKWTVIVCLNCLGEIYCGMGVLDKSKHYFMRAIRLAVAINGMDLVARVSVNTARTIQLLGDCASATALLQAALAHPSTEHEAREKAVCWLDEMNAESAVALNEARLGEEVEKLLLAATPHPENRS